MNKNALLASDMDGTVIPLDNKKKSEEEITDFFHLIERHDNVVLAYVTGRHLESGLAGVEKYGLPIPHIFVCDVGTSIYFNNYNEWRLDEAYRFQLLDSMNGFSGSDIAGILEGVPKLVAQEDERQKEFKQSYYIPAGDDYKSIMDSVEERLAGSGIKANIIYSVGARKKIGLLDVLPNIAAKDYALEYLWRSLGFEKDKVVYAGDSGNDLLAFVSGFNAIVVNNTAEAVKKEVRRQAAEKNIEDRTFFASRKFVSGVMEGCFHFKLFSETEE